MKTYCKQNKYTINDYATSLILTSVKEYCESKSEYKVPENVYYTFAMSMREPVKNISEVLMRNETYGISLEVPLKKEIKD